MDAVRTYFMKLRTFFTAIAIGSVGFVATSTQAQEAPSACETYKCVAGISGYGTSPNRSCAPALQVFFKIAVFNPPPETTADKHEFDPAATAAERKKYLMTCPDAAADANTLTAIINKWMNVK
jgi:hypothetical protein